MLTKFRPNDGKETPAISTASLPDIVFMLLFFFMVTTVMRDTDLLVEQRLPQTNQLTKLEEASLVSHIYVGKPKDFRKYGNTELIQANDVFVTLERLSHFIEQEKGNIPEYKRNKMTVSLKVDRKAKMGIVSDIKLKLREANARKLNYSSLQERE
ncbi:biopolymer transporter ExbD [uncultured Microscilla sp.]|uniref:ExbD/TolR family protein n=1 Tax=uncultured Microscilla sp. TaxID=432653 RepID=UPI00262D0249|nr:biopolymer transporter ExbD [uncultured Microscilla sp.]